MKSKKRLLRESLVYAIIDKRVAGKRAILDIAKRLKNSKAGVIQFRDKESKRECILRCAARIHRLLSKSKKLFIINDYIDIAKIVDSDGLHLGQDDLQIKIARRLLGKDKIIGISCHNLKQAMDAQKKGADYISIGPIFKTPTKPEYSATGIKLIKECVGKIKIPFFAIGGINQDNVNRISSLGAKRVAMCRAACNGRI